MTAYPSFRIPVFENEGFRPFAQSSNVSGYDRVDRGRAESRRLLFSLRIRAFEQRTGRQPHEIAGERQLARLPAEGVFFPHEFLE